MFSAALLALALMTDPTPAELQAWLREVDDARTAFGEAKITARATELEDGRVKGTADFDVYVKGRDRALVVFHGGKTVVSEMEIHDLLGPNAKAMTRLEYLDIQPAHIDDSIFTPDGARAFL